MRNTDYAEEIKTVRIDLESGGEARMELLGIKDRCTKEIRFSHWYNGKLQRLPLELPEEEFLLLIGDAIKNGVLTPQCVNGLRTLCEMSSATR